MAKCVVYIAFLLFNIAFQMLHWVYSGRVLVTIPYFSIYFKQTCIHVFCKNFLASLTSCAIWFLSLFLFVLSDVNNFMFPLSMRFPYWFRVSFLFRLNNAHKHVSNCVLHDDGNWNNVIFLVFKLSEWLSICKYTASECSQSDHI